MALQLIPAIHRSAHQIGLLLGEVDGLDVDQAEAHILAHLADHGDSTIAQLHQAFGHRRSTLTSILDRLTERRLLKRETSKADRRSFVVHLTADGAYLARRVSRLLNQLEDRVFKGVPAGTRRSMLEVLARFERRAAGDRSART